MRPRYFRRRQRRPARSVISDIADPVWGIDPDRCTYAQLRAYQEHFDEIQFYGVNQYVLQTTPAIISLVTAVRNASKRTIREILSAIEATQPSCLKTGYTEQSTESAFLFACKLWLFLDIPLDDKDAVFKDAVKQELDDFVGQPSKVDSLSHDFSHKTLTRKAGMKVEWTSNLRDHLRYNGDSKVYIFRHAQVLGSYDTDSEEVFPNGFLEETSQTLSLLFPPGAIKDERRNQRTSEKYYVDIELAVPPPATDLRDLRQYKYWQAQLGQLMAAYNDSRPRKLRQWWFDRRNRNEWAAFWIAVVVFILTVFFGVIQSVTGIVSAVFAYRALSVPPGS